MKNLHLYRVVVAIEEESEDGKVTREFKVIYDETECTTASAVRPNNILRRSELAEKLAGTPSEEILTSVVEVKLTCPFL